MLIVLRAIYDSQSWHGDRPDNRQAGPTAAVKVAKRILASFRWPGHIALVPAPGRLAVGDPGYRVRSRT